MRLARAPGLGLDLVCGPARRGTVYTCSLNGRALPRGVVEEAYGRSPGRCIRAARRRSSRSVRRRAGARWDERLDLLDLGLADEEHLDDALLDRRPVGGEPGLRLCVLRVCPLLLPQLRAPREATGQGGPDDDSADEAGQGFAIGPGANFRPALRQAHARPLGGELRAHR